MVPSAAGLLKLKAGGSEVPNNNPVVVGAEMPPNTNELFDVLVPPNSKPVLVRVPEVLESLKDDEVVVVKVAP